MQLTRFTDYALRILINLGLQPDRLMTISEVAANYDVSESHLTKVVNLLAQKGYLETVRGKGGGMRLSRRPDLINLGDVVRDAEENFYTTECFNTELQDCPLLPGCALKSVMVQATKNFLATLDEYSLADLLPQQTPKWHTVSIVKKGGTASLPAGDVASLPVADNLK